MIIPPRARPGDRVAVVSPSAGLPGIFPHPFELGLRRLREDFDLVPVEYPTTRRMGSSPQDRARDLHAAYADPSITAIITSAGGSDQLTVLKHLDPAIITANPKPFFGLSDNTNFLNYQYNLGIVGYHFGGVMTALGRGGAVHPQTGAAFRAALFTGGEFELTPATRWTDLDRDWNRPEFLATEPEETFGGEGWEFDHADGVVEGRLWGGCLEVLAWNLMAGIHIRPAEEYAGRVLFLETSQEMPDATTVSRFLVGAGERGLLGRFAAILVGRPKAGTIDGLRFPEFPAEQRAAVRAALSEYAPGVPVVHNLDIGHTDPNLVLPYGGRVRIDGPARKITVTY